LGEWEGGKATAAAILRLAAWEGAVGLAAAETASGNADSGFEGLNQFYVGEPN